MTTLFRHILLLLILDFFKTFKLKLELFKKNNRSKEIKKNKLNSSINININIMESYL